MYMEEFTNKTNIYKAKTFGTTHLFMQIRQAYICFDAIYVCLSLKNADSTTLFRG